jgi:hypothetical protein
MSTVGVVSKSCKLLLKLWFWTYDSEFEAKDLTSQPFRFVSLEATYRLQHAVTFESLSIKLYLVNFKNENFKNGVNENSFMVFVTVSPNTRHSVVASEVVH